jgi:hypothetical protein
VAPNGPRHAPVVGKQEATIAVPICRKTDS